LKPDLSLALDELLHRPIARQEHSAVSGHGPIASPHPAFWNKTRAQITKNRTEPKRLVDASSWRTPIRLD
jgi:hypothetical protein